MTKIIPAILPSSYRAIELGVEKVEPMCKTIQIDFVDGFFATNRTWLFNNKDEDKVEAILNEEMGLPYWETVNYEFDLMIKDPLTKLDRFFSLGPAKIILHIESLNVEETKKYFEELPEIVRSAVKFVMAIGIETPIETLAPLMEYCSGIQCMGIVNVGFQGQKFDDRVLEKISTLKALYPNKKISVDGGVNLDTVPELVLAGADELVVGSVIFQSNDIYATIEKIKSLCRINSTTTENFK